MCEEDPIMQQRRDSGHLQMIKDYYTGFRQDKLTRPEFQEHKLGICVEFPTTLLEFIDE
jgi:hypothetical protein